MKTRKKTTKKQRVLSLKKRCNLASNGAIPLWDTLGVDITGIGQAVAAVDLWLTALHLIPCETSLAAAAVVGALHRSKTHLISALNNEKRTSSGSENQVASLSDKIILSSYHRVVTQRVGGAAAIVGPFAFVDVVADLK